MNNHISKKQYTESFFKNTGPTKLTEARKLKLQTEAWGILTDYFLESVKINKHNNVMKTVATLKIGDRSGHVTCLVRGPTVGLLFDLTPAEWLEVEKLNFWSDQLFYRYFKNGLKNTFSYEQKLFYNFCLSNQNKDILVAVYHRCTNWRNFDKNDAVLEIVELKKCNTLLLDIYTEHLNKKCISA